MKKNSYPPEYQKLMEQTPQIKASGLEDDYRSLAEFNNVVLAGHQTRFGMEFVTWEWVQNHSTLWQGHYHGDSYAAAKKDFVTRSGLLPQEQLFSNQQLTEIYRCIHETLERGCLITAEREKLLTGAAEQIETAVPYDGTGKIVTSTDKSGHTTSYEYDANGNLVSTTDPDGYVTKYTYNSLDLVTHINYNGDKQVDSAYNATGNQTSVAYPDGTTTKEYDLVGNLTKVIEDACQTTIYAYGGMGRVTHMEYPDGWMENYHYDALGQLTAIEDTDPTRKNMKQ